MSAEWEAAIAAEEAAIVGLPQRGLVLLRAAGAEHAALCRYPSGVPLWQPAGAPTSLAVGDNGLWAAVMVSTSDEASRLWLVHTRERRATRIAAAAFRHDAPVYDPVSGDFLVVSTPEARLYRVTPGRRPRGVCPVPPGERWRLFEGPRGPLLAISVPGEPTRLRPAPRPALAPRRSPVPSSWELSLPSVRGVSALRNHAVVRSARAARGFDPLTGRVLWEHSAGDGRVIDALATPAGVTIAEQREGRPSLLRLDGAGVTDARAVELPAWVEGGVVSGLALHRGEEVLRWESALEPPRLYRLDALEASPPAPSDLGHTLRHGVMAEDGAIIDVVLSLPPGPATRRPVLLSCYGGFGEPHLPVYEPSHAAWVRAGGVVAHAQIRGGDERGRSWWEQAKGSLKVRAVWDLSRVVEQLSLPGLPGVPPAPVVLAGGSLGGVVAAASAFDGRRLCAGLITTAAPLDLERLDEHPLGSLWLNEFPSSETPEGRAALRELSPLRRAATLPPGRCPPYLGVVMANDARVGSRDTVDLVRLLRSRGHRARLHVVPCAGHAANPLSALRRLGAACLSFAAAATGGVVRPTLAPERTPS